MITTIPLVDPPNTFRASTLSDCYRIISLPNSIVQNYQVGVVMPSGEKIFKIQNKTVSHSLRITVGVPSFMNSSVPHTFVLPPEEIKEVRIVLNESNIKMKVMTGVREFTENVSVTIEPINVTGPVHVRVE